jgi:plasmid stabilization system protein ParE
VPQSTRRDDIVVGTTHEENDMPRSWSDKRERQYEHIKKSYEERGRSQDKAEELAARTVNKERSEAGETKSSRKR